MTDLISCNYLRRIYNSAITAYLFISRILCMGGMCNDSNDDDDDDIFGD